MKFFRWLSFPFAGVVSALVHAILDELPLSVTHGDRNRVTAFIVAQHARMPDFLRMPFLILTLGFDVSGWLFFGRSFRNQTRAQRRAQIGWWKASPLGVCRDFIRFFESLATVGWTDPSLPSIRFTATLERTPKRRGEHLEESAVIIGSGPGGAVTAALLAEHGVKPLLIEEGKGDANCGSFTIEEMFLKYRNGGLTPALGKPKIPYVEGNCIGGGSEINSGLYHRTPPEILARWQKEYGLAAEQNEMETHFEAVERDVSVSHLPGLAPTASLKLAQGAEKLGWRCLEVPRWYRYDAPSGPSTGERQSMSRTYLPRLSKAGGTVLAGARAERILRRKGRWEVRVRRSTGEVLTVTTPNVFVSAGAIGTPALLQRSRIPGRFGRSLHLHPTIKVVALFNEEINAPDMGVPVHQVKEFAPAFSFGCSISTEPYLALAMLDHPRHLHLVAKHWRRMAIYYAMIVPQARGRVQALPWFNDPLVRFQVAQADLQLLATALRRLCELLFTAGAVQLFPSVSEFPALSSKDELSKIPNVLPRQRSSLMTIHLTSSCPMGERSSVCPVNSYGEVIGQEGLYVADASGLPSAPGVNPQGSIMAFARRNALHFLDKNHS
jgi:choline dehydrogenase-like flavoprotein